MVKVRTGVQRGRVHSLLSQSSEQSQGQSSSTNFPSVFTKQKGNTKNNSTLVIQKETLATKIITHHYILKTNYYTLLLRTNYILYFYFKNQLHFHFISNNFDFNFNYLNFNLNSSNFVEIAFK